MYKLNPADCSFQRPPLNSHSHGARRRETNLISRSCGAIHLKVQELVVGVSRDHGSPFGDSLDPLAVSQVAVWNPDVGQQSPKRLSIVARVVRGRGESGTKTGIQDSIIGLNRGITSVHVLRQERGSSQRGFHGIFQRCAAVQRQRNAVGRRIEGVRQVLHVSEPGDSALVFGPGQYRIRIL